MNDSSEKPRAAVARDAVSFDDEHQPTDVPSEKPALPTIQQALRQAAEELDAHHGAARTVMLDAANELDRLFGLIHADGLSRMHMLDQAHQDIRYLCDRLNSIEAALTGSRGFVR